MFKKILAALTVASATALPLTAWAEAPFEGYSEKYIEVVNHISCFPMGIDMLGRGDVDGGLEVFRSCWSEDLESRLNFVRASIVCPGETCRFLADHPDLRGGEMRGTLALIAFEMAGFTNTHHAMDTIHVEFDGPANATVNANITATHMSDTKGPEVHFIRWTAELVDTDAGWRITEEEVHTTGHGVIPFASE